ncbi:PAS domain S-box protein [Bacillus sp. P14.5]|uniref:PAS domain S-box protein n=1 Tax=Bacillus sp. P14.5 TaxID=1983400 RepID=UPI000DE829B3|nr:PAS domain S-box protein [Bacillus sp. P14.5]
MSALFNLFRKSQHSASELRDSSLQEQNNFKLLFEHSPNIIIHFDTKGRFLNINRAATSITGHELPAIDLVVTDFTPEESKEVIWKYFKAAVNGKVQNFSCRAYHKNGNLLNLENTYIPIKENRKIIGVYAIIHEVSEKAALQSALETKEQEMEQVSEALEAAIWSYDSINKSITFCTQGIKYITEMEAGNFLKGKIQWRDLVYIDDLKKFDEDRKPLKDGETICHRYRIITPSGKVKWVNDKIIPINDEHNRIVRYHGIITDITNDKELGDRVEHLLHHDSLTALPNRKTLEIEMTTLIKEKRILPCFTLILTGLNT